MPLIFVDANVYLDSYRSAPTDSYRDLLRSLTALGGRVFVTNQVKLEVERNRVNVYEESSKFEPSFGGLGKFRVTPHYADDTSTTVAITWDVLRDSGPRRRMLDERAARATN